MPRTRASESQELVALKRTLAGTMRKQRITVGQLARQLGTNHAVVRRALDVKHRTTSFRTVQRTAHALGFAVRLEPKPLTPGQLGDIARRMVATKNAEAGDRLQARLVNGFFGDAESQP